MQLDGVGYVFSADDPYVGIDLDTCRDLETGVIEPWAVEIVDDIGSYTEISPSGRGVHIIGRGTIPGDRHRAGNIEMYDSVRFFRMTGDALEGCTQITDCQPALDRLYAKTFPTKTATPAPVQQRAQSAMLDDQAVIERAMHAKNGDRFQRLWNGDTTGYSDDESRADLALCSLISFYTQDQDQVDRVFRQSALYRPKWERAGYRERTIGTALQRSDVWTPSGTSRMPPVAAIPSTGMSMPDDHDGPAACGTELARIAALEQQLAARDARIAALEAEVENHRRIDSLRAQVASNPKMSEGSKLMLMALVPEIESVRSGAGAPIDPRKRDRRIAGKSIVINRAVMAERIGCKPDAAGDRITKLCDAGLFTKTYRPRAARDAETGKLLQGDGGKELLLEPVFEDLDVLLNEATKAETPGRVNHGGRRDKITCPDHPDARIVRRRTDIFACEDCGQITGETVSTKVIDPKRQLDCLGADPLGPPTVAHNVLISAIQTLRVETEANRQVDASGSGTQQQLCSLCRRPLRNDDERAAGCHSYDCQAPDIPLPVPMDGPLFAMADD
jgi:hypothetical protein